MNKKLPKILYNDLCYFIFTKNIPTISKEMSNFLIFILE